MQLLFFFNDTATTEIYTLSLHDALPISAALDSSDAVGDSAYTLEVSTRGIGRPLERPAHWRRNRGDRKSTRLNSSHANISYAVFCLKKKKLRYVGVILVDSPVAHVRTRP